MQNLETGARDLLAALGGHWTGSGGMCRCPAHDDRTPSLSVTVGKKALLFKCFAGCSRDEVMSALKNQNFQPGVKSSEVVTKDRPSKPHLQRAAQSLWTTAVRLRDTPGEKYLAERSLLTKSPELRYLSHTPLGSAGHVRYLPAIIAAVRADQGVVAIQRIYLDDDVDEAAAISPCRRSLGPLGIGSRSAGLAQ